MGGRKEKGVGLTTVQLASLLDHLNSGTIILNKSAAKASRERREEEPSLGSGLATIALMIGEK